MKFFRAFNFETFLQRLITVGLALTLLTPLAFHLRTPFISPIPQATLMRIIVEALLVLYVALIMVNRTYLPRRTTLLIAVIAHFAIITLTSVFGINPARSFWGTMVRGEGLFTYLHYLVLFIIASAVVRDQASWRWLLRTLVVASIPMGIMGIFQTQGLYTLRAVDCLPPRCFRINGTFGNSGYYGSYLAMVILISLFLAVLEKKKRWQWLFGALIVANFALLLLTASRSSWIAVLVGFAIVYGGWFFSLPYRAKGKRLVLLLAVLVFCGSVLAVFILREVKIIPDYSLLRRFDDLTFSFFTRENSRFFVWETSLKAWKEHPLVGSGLESTLYYYDRFYDPKFLKYVDEHVFFDRAHNHVIELLVSSGLVGLLSYLVMVGLALQYIVRARRQLGIRAVFVLAALFVVHEVQNIFTFKILATHLLFFFMLAYVNSRFCEIPRLSLGRVQGFSGHVLRYAVKGGVVGFCAALAWFGIFRFNIQPYRASRALFESFELTRANRLSKAFAQFDRALARMPEVTKFEMRFMYTVILSNWQEVLLAMDATGEANKVRRKLMADKLKELLPAIAQYLDRRPDGPLLSAYFLLMQRYGDLATLYDNKQYLLEGWRVFTSAFQVNPRHQRVYHYGGFLHVLNKDLAKALDLFARAYALDQNVIDYLEWQGKAYILAGKTKEGREKGVNFFRSAMKLDHFYGGGLNVDLLRQLAGIYARENNFPAVVALYEEALTFLPKGSFPNDYRFYTDLAQAYSAIGNSAKAKATVDKSKQLFPLFTKSIDQAMESKATQGTF